MAAFGQHIFPGRPGETSNPMPSLTNWAVVAEGPVRPVQPGSSRLVNVYH